LRAMWTRGKSPSRASALLKKVLRVIPGHFLRRASSSVHSLTRMHVSCGVRRLRPGPWGSRGWSGPWCRQSRTFGPGRRPPHRYHQCVARPSAHVGPKGLPTPESTRRVSCRTSQHTVAARPVGARLRAISQQGGDATSLAGSMRPGANARWHAMKPEVDARRRKASALCGYSGAGGDEGDHE